MADKLISRINLGSAIYHLKDEKARKDIETLQTTLASSLVLKGVVSNATAITSLVNYKTGWTYKANDIFALPNLGIIEPGDMIICISDYSTAFKTSDWTVVQNNVDVMQGATTSAKGVKGLVPAPGTTDVSSYLKGDGTWGIPTVDQVGANTNANYIIFDCGSSTVNI